jgi:hypothetical protein
MQSNFRVEEGLMTCNPKSTGIGLAVGVAIGTALGAAFHNLGLWLGIGVALGLVLPMCTETKASATEGTKKES